MGLVEGPWARVKDPTPIPASVDADVLKQMDELGFAMLLRDQLLPRAPEERASWQRLWDVLFDDDELANRAFDVLETFLDDVEGFLQDPAGAKDHELKRARKFQMSVESAWDRLKNTERLPAPAVVRRLVFAITKHRALRKQSGEVTEHDQELWRSLDRLGLDSGR